MEDYKCPVDDSKLYYLEKWDSYYCQKCDWDYFPKNGVMIRLER